MKVQNLAISLWILSLIPSCKSQSNHPEVFLGFRMGSSQNQIATRRDELLKMNLIRLKDNLFIHTNTTNSGLANKTYYSTPIFNISPGDTLCSEITVEYFDDLNYTSNIVANMKEGTDRFAFNLTTKADGELKIGDYVKKDVLNELENKYGKYIASDTAYDAVGVYKEGYVWKMEKDIIVNLNYGIWKSEMIEAAGLRLEFTYTDEMRSKLFKKTSTY
jgi:hypothetical protein